ncbi:MAG: hypothetical protein AAFQ87_23880, partial [Bacteroidota bacterium]
VSPKETTPQRLSSLFKTIAIPTRAVPPESYGELDIYTHIFFSLSNQPSPLFRVLHAYNCKLDAMEQYSTNNVSQGIAKGIPYFGFSVFSLQFDPCTHRND